MPSPPKHDWSYSASEYLRRSVSLAVIYDAGFHGSQDRGNELFQIIAHGCIVGPNEVITCREALDAVNMVAEHKHGTAIIIVGMAWYEFAAEKPDEASGLSLCRLTRRDEAKWNDAQALYRRLGVGELRDDSQPVSIRHTTMPWIGQEIGFIHTGEAEDAARDLNAYAHLQFDSSVISHFRRVAKDGLKTFITGVLPGRILRSGVAVFARDSTLLGIISDTASYPSDAGRRAIVRSLLGHPRFTTFKKNSQ